MTPRFVFRHTWRLPCAPRDVWPLLADPAGFPRWWPDVRAARRLDADAVAVDARSTLPFTLHLVMTREVEDPAAGVLRARLSGDLVGFVEARVLAVPDGSVVHWAQECVLEAPGVAPLAYLPPLRAVLRGNHAAMMRRGSRGLRRAVNCPDLR